jgi:AAA15 family ATPase/GTPase
MIITQIVAKNFYGIKDEIKINFTEGGSKEKIGYMNRKKQRISLISGFYGANASGKSTILNVIDTIIRVMLVKQQDFTLGPNGIKQETVIALPNYDVSMKSKPIELKIEFIIKDNLYSYLVDIIDEGKEISREVLQKNGKNIFSRTNHKIQFDPVIKSKISSVAENIIAPKKSSFLSILLDDTSDVSVFTDLKKVVGISELIDIKDKICFITDKRTIQLGQNNINGLLGFAINYLNDKDTKSANRRLDTVNSVVRYFEPSLKHISINPVSKNPSDSVKNPPDFTFDYIAEYNNFSKPLPIMELSAGTREIISYINDVLRIIKSGGIVVYDETSKYYHPDMEIAILNLFKDRNINKNNAQLFFSSHNHETFDLLQNAQAHIVEKTNGNILVSKVSDYDVKERDNIKKRYRLGVLGGVPDTIDFNRVIRNLL